MLISAQFTAVKDGRHFEHEKSSTVLGSPSEAEQKQHAYKIARDWCAIRGHALTSIEAVNIYNDDHRPRFQGSITTGLDPEVVFEEDIRKMTVLEVTAALRRCDVEIPSFLTNDARWPSGEAQWGAVSAQATALHAFILDELAEREIRITDLPCMADGLNQKAKDFIDKMTHSQLLRALEISIAEVTQDDPIELAREIAWQEFSLNCLDMNDLKNATKDNEGQISNEAWAVINRLDREQLEGTLEGHGFAVHDHETDADLCQAIAVNVADGTIEISELEALLDQQRSTDRPQG